jgi:hypothetical protein
MQGPATWGSIVTIPFGATTGERIVLNGVLGAILVYNAANQLIYSIAPDGASSNVPVFADGAGNAVLSGATSYFIAGQVAAVQTDQGLTSFLTAASPTQMTPWSVIGTMGVPPGGTQLQLAITDSANSLEISAPAPSGSSPTLFVNGVMIDELYSPLSFASVSNPGTPPGPVALWGTGTNGLRVNYQTGWNARVSSSQSVSTNINTITGITPANLSLIAYQGGDGAGTRYRFSIEGVATWGATVHSLFLQPFIGTLSNLVGTPIEISSTAFAASAALFFTIVASFSIITSGVTGTWRVYLSGIIGQVANQINPGTAASNVVPFATGTSDGADAVLDTTSPQSLGVAAWWFAAGPSISKEVAIAERLGI